MELMDLATFFLGDSDSIRSVVNSRYSLVVGAIFVMTAGLARSWNRRDLIDKPWYLLLPFLASAASALAMTILLSVWWFGPLERLHSNVFTYFPVILCVFWMTGPLAWIYGFSFERWLSPLRSVKARLIALLIVSIWRVVLSIVALQVLFQVSIGRSVFFVLTFGNWVALAAMYFSRPRNEPTDVPKVLMVMGVIMPKYQNEYQVVRKTSCFLVALMIGFGVISFPYFLKQAYSNRASFVELAIRESVSFEVWAATIASLLVWAVLTVFGQRRTRNDTRVRRLIVDGNHIGAVNLLEQKRRSDFTHGWRLPLEDSLYGHAAPERMLDFFDASRNAKTPDWAKGLAEESLSQFVSDPLLYWYDDEMLNRVLLRIEDLGASMNAELASETLHRLDRLKGAHEWLDELDEYLHDSDDDRLDGDRKRDSERVELERKKESEIDPHPLQQELEDGAYAEWPELNESRQQLWGWLREKAGDIFQSKAVVARDRQLPGAG